MNLWRWIWKQVALFAYRRWAGPAKNRQKPFGLPGFRDPHSRCDYYSPRKGQSDFVTTCNGDGHSLCHECVNYKPEPANEDDDNWR